ncbi:class I SAM-dependent methyltransferase [Parasulfitobacter algicola]|uniref:Class I SAM-dependent methyltransferase n=1 Tax=Parasulfitobacter algicola TaxID=2614809 RepID=A0ABX2IVS7_9RHOB|nr:class I SAM-dependent methyltransferase [Sulfitobacter algicola]NSX57034.1 class I SAM-dependent methyltransferase [Sulfitobacter algicola]
MADTHSALMDQVYRRQRFFYDATRKYYLLGRDYALRQIKAKEGAHILEIACGTGRNLDQIDMRYPNRHLYGLDISSEMLLSARRKLGDRAKLAQADACAFDPANLFDQAKYDHIVMSYCVSMIPQWQSAIKEAVSHLAPGGALHIVDFGDQSRMPRWFDRGLRKWLARFHVEPRYDLKANFSEIEGHHISHVSLMRSYVTYVCVRKRMPAMNRATNLT